MEKFVTYISGYLGVNSVLDVVLMVVDIAIVAFLIYKIATLLRNTRAFSLLKSLLFIFIASYVAGLLNLYVVKALLDVVLNVLPVVLVVLFAPEIRKFLENLGKKKLADIIKNLSGKGGADGAEELETKRIVDETVTAVFNMAAEKTGAIMVFEKDDDIREWDRQGVLIDANVTSRLIEQIFVVNTPLHDAAVLVREGRIYAAQCVLPLTDNTELSRELGTRHRAAVGASEKADCVVVVVSEETGIVSVAKNGELYRKFTPDTLRRMLLDELLPENSTNSTDKKGGLKKKNRKEGV